ncbi:hypothetical protein [Streptosporangium sp. OZ121]|uniref:hypothetical protein n=1 Tax=Streptosporangium sp. OZ121 TaxID=3444183 RepID=UPI003F7A6247
MRVSKMVLAVAVAGVVAGAVAVPVHAAGAVGVAVSGAGVSAHDGESVYRGLILGIGPVAERFPEIVRPDGGVTARQEEFASAVVAAVSRKDPAFLASFGREMTSGDRVRIDRAFTAAQDITRDVLAERFGFKADSSAVDQAAGLAFFVYMVYLGNVYEIVNVYKVANAVRESNVYEIENWTESLVSKDLARLDRERFVDLVAERLAA